MSGLSVAAGGDAERRVTYLARWSALLLLVPLVIILLRAAWMNDDAYITQRTVDNLVNGHGLTWNTDERVQAYTHPLWMLVLAAAYFVTHESYYTTLAISLAITLLTAVLLVRMAYSPPAAVFALVSLSLSRAFVDYSTSGLENALTHLLLALYLLVYFREYRRETRLWLLSFIFSLVALNRLDAVLLLLPAFGLVLWEYRAAFRRRPWRSVGIVFLGLAPFVAWELFSLFYYGAPFPNTFYAKLMAGAPQSELARRGVIYMVQSARMDPLIPLLIAGGLLTALWTRRASFLAVASGIVLYLAYVVSIGGDFMGGRFLTAPLFCSVLLIAAAPLIRTFAGLAAPLLVVLFVGLVSPYSPARSTTPGCTLGGGGTDVTDERSCWFDGTGLINQSSENDVTPGHPLAEYGREVRDDPRFVHVIGNAGLFGFFAGPEKHIVDLNALTDPLLARLPMPAGKPWRVGHFERLVPAGYLESLESGENLLCDDGLAQYYEKLTLITRGPLLDLERLKTIIRMNLGQYDYLVAAYGAQGDPDNQLCNAQHKAQVQFVTGPRLVGYSVSPTPVKPGELLSVTLYWQDRPEGRKEGVASFLKLRDSAYDSQSNPVDGSTVWAEDRHNDPGGRFTSEYWPTQVYVDMHALPLPDDMPPGEYFIEVGFYDPRAKEQLAVVPESVQPPLQSLPRSLLLPLLQVE